MLSPLKLMEYYKIRPRNVKVKGPLNDDDNPEQKEHKQKSSLAKHAEDAKKNFMTRLLNQKMWPFFASLAPLREKRFFVLRSVCFFSFYKCA